MKEGRVLEVGSLNDSIDRAGLLTEATEDALCHVNIILGRSSGAIRARLRFDRDGESGAGRLAELAGDAALFTSRVATQGVLTSEHGAEGSLLPRVMDDVL